MLTYGSLFSGIGCFDLASCNAGWKPLWQCELDADCRRVLAKHWPSVERHADVTQIDPATLPPVDLIIGGFPCQSVSVAGKRGGLKDERKSGLFWQMARIIETVRPRFVLWENVPGLLTGADSDETDMDGDRGTDGQSGGSIPWMSAILGEFRRIGYRHGVWRILDGLHWVPQRRRRVFGLFARGPAGNGIRLASEASGEDLGGLVELLAEVLLEQDGSGRNPAKGKRPRANDSATLGGGVAGDSRGLIPDVLKHVGGGHFRAGEPSLAASDDNGSNQVVVQPFNVVGLAQVGRNHAYASEATGALQHKGNNPTGNEAGTVVVLKGAAIGRNPSAVPQRGETLTDGTTYTLQTTEVPAVAYSFQERGREGGRVVDWIENEAYTLLAPAGGSRSQERNVAYAADGLICRRLTPTECLRLQGLPDNWLDLDDGGKPLSDSKKYHMIGNGGVVPCVQWILARLRNGIEKRLTD